LVKPAQTASCLGDKAIEDFGELIVILNMQLSLTKYPNVVNNSMTGLKKNNADCSTVPVRTNRPRLAGTGPLVRIYQILFLIVFLSNGCTEEITLNLDKALRKPLVYCILNPRDSVQYLRVQRIFLGDENALVMAKNPDSIYFKNVTATIERIENGIVKETLRFIPSYSIQKDTGLFTTQNHVIWELREKIVSGATYSLNVEVDQFEEIATATTIPNTDLSVIKWNGWPGNTINMVNDRFATVVWKRLPGVHTYELSYIFHYYDLTATDTTRHEVVWKVPDEIYAMDDQNDSISYEVPISQWFGILSDKIPRLPEVIRRIAGKFDLLWEFKGADFEDFNKRNQLVNKEMWIDYPAYSNINNAIGIFSFATKFKVSNIGISLYTLEKITTNPLTKDLKFDARVDW
jgi:hypothetical protein